MNREKLIDALEDLDPRLFVRYFEIKEKLRKKRIVRRTLVKCTSVAACFLLISTMIYGAVQNYELLYPQESVETPDNTEALISVGDIEMPKDFDDVIWLPNNAENAFEGSAGEIWNGLNVSYGLSEALRKSNDNDWFAMYVFNEGDLDAFEYNGKTYKEHKDEVKNLRMQSVILEILLKEGEKLKYGELIYTEGLPNGMKWHKQFYDERVAFYGEEMLDEYIVDNTFLSEKVINDISEIKTKIKAMEDMTEEILDAYRVHQSNELFGIFDNAGYYVTIKNGRLLLFITKRAFASLDIENKYSLSFSLASRSAVEDKAIPAFTVGHN